jgi:Flp pilus assembly protein TadD
MRAYVLYVLIGVLSCGGCASTGSSGSNMLTSWWKPRTNELGSTIPRKSLFDWGKSDPAENAHLLAGSDTPIPHMPKRKVSTLHEKDAKLTESLAIGNSLEQGNQWEKARKHYEQLSKENATSEKVWHRLAVVNDRLKRHSEAQGHYATALKLNPSNAELRNDLGYSYFLQGQLAKAQAEMNLAVEMEPHNSRFRNNLGLVLGHKGELEAALVEFRKAGSDADAYYNLAFIHASKEKVDEAKLCFRKAMLADPTHEKSREALASFERYERTPEELLDDVDITSQGSKQWVAYVEGMEKQNADNTATLANGKTLPRSTGQILNDAPVMNDNNVQPASATSPVTNANFPSSHLPRGQYRSMNQNTNNQ